MAIVSQIPGGESSVQGRDELLSRYLAHELRSPLASIVTLVSILYSETGEETGKFGSLSTVERQMLESIKRCGFHALDVVEQVYSLNEFQMGRVLPEYHLHDMRKFLTDLYMDTRPLFRNGSELDYRLELPFFLPSMLIDPNRLRQAISNLLSNARRFTQTGQVVLGACVLDGEIHIYVRDTGVGIPAVDHEKIFEPYARRHDSDGFGFGLTLVREFMRILGGSISFDSQEGLGSTFRLHLPMARVA